MKFIGEFLADTVGTFSVFCVKAIVKALKFLNTASKKWDELRS